uniref:Nck-associated protein 5-like n=1 Tax=Sinocyclocheilus rhinocerous TaxID=307959 RepID=A0A673MC16_9TELE
MSEEAQNRVDEDFESEEGDLESYLEEESSSELLERVRELQAENSALSLANESQREAYERCLDEVANHVVQALLNQKDLREECIKLKMRVFDLERQNRTLCELLQEKLHSQSCSEECTGQETQGSSTSMEAMSPFLKKKAHILEVLRKLEETDPLRYHRSSGIPSICDCSQALASNEAVLACPITIDNLNLARPDFQENMEMQSLVKPATGTSELFINRTSGDMSILSAEQGLNPPNDPHSLEVPESYSRLTISERDQPRGSDHVLVETRDKNRLSDLLLESQSNRSSGKFATKEDADCVCRANIATSKLPTLGLKENEPVHKGLLFSPNENHTASKVLDDISVPVKDTPSDPQSIRSKVVVSPNQVSCLREVKASPSKLLKFLKIPTLGERTAVPAPPRLSPQLTRSSKIPCRSNNYEVHNSPVAPRKATTTERQRQLPPSKSESHSAPTSPPHSHVQKTPQKIPHYENVSDISKTCSTDVSQLLGEVSSSLQNSSPKVQSGISTRSRSQEKNEMVDNDSQISESPFKRNDPPPVPKKSGIGRHSGESSHSFKERLAALGKLRNPDESTTCPPLAEKKEIQSAASISTRTTDKSKIADRNSDCKSGEYRLPKNTDSIEDKSYHSGHLDGAVSKQPAFQHVEQAVRSLPSSTLVSKLEHESSRTFLAKQESPKSKMHPPSTNLEVAQALRSYAKSTTPHSLSYNGKNVAGPHSGSPNKIPLKSPTKTVPPLMNRDGKPTQEFQRYMSKSEDRSHLRANKKKNSSYGESLPPPPPRPVESAEEKRHSAPSPQSSIEQKVMKGIEENMLKLQEQDKGQTAEVKQKASNGIANWFGLRKSKLPALSRKPETSKVKDDKREWKLNISSVGKDSKGAARKTESESLNISMLIEKAEGLHKALEEERAYMNGVALDRQGKGHSCEVVMDQSQGQLSVMYRGVPSDNFMQQLLNRLVQNNLYSNYTCTTYTKVFYFDICFKERRHKYIFQGGKKREKNYKDVTSDENLAETIHHEHFAGSGISTHTLDSGIGTFPLPDYSANAGCKSIPKGKAHGESDPSHLQGKHGSGMKMSHKAWTLERELSSLEEDYMGGQDMDHHTMFLFPLFLSFDLLISGTDICGAPMKLGPTKNWTFPNLKASAEPSEVYLGVGDGVEPVSHKTSFKRVSITLDPSVTQQDNYNNFLFY